MGKLRIGISKHAAISGVTLDDVFRGMCSALLEVMPQFWLWRVFSTLLLAPAKPPRLPRLHSIGGRQTTVSKYREQLSIRGKTRPQRKKENAIICRILIPTSHFPMQPVLCEHRAVPVVLGQVSPGPTKPPDPAETPAVETMSCTSG
jgi:hypothetical protein